MKTRSRDLASWLPLAAGASSRNLVFTFQLSTVDCRLRLYVAEEFLGSSVLTPLGIGEAGEESEELAFERRARVVRTMGEHLFSSEGERERPNAKTVLSD